MADEAWAADRTTRARRERIDARLEQLDADLEAARQAIGGQITTLAYERRLPVPHSELRSRVFGALERVTLHMRKGALADPHYDPADAARHDGLRGVDANFLILCGEMILGAALNGPGDRRQEPARSTRAAAPPPIDRAAVARRIVQLGAQRRGEAPPDDGAIVIDLMAHERIIR